MEEPEDRHYFLLSIGNLTLSLGEGLSIALFGLTASLGFLNLFIYSLSHRHLLFARTRLFLRRFWVIPFFILILFICLGLSSLLFDQLLKIGKAPPKYDEYAAITLTFLLAFSLYFLVSPLFSRRPFPRRAHYYGTAAVLMLALGTFIAAVLDFTFVPLFLWAFALALLAAITPSKLFTAIFSLLAPLELVLSALACIGSGDKNPARFMLSGELAIELILAFLLLPFIFLFRRVFILFSSPKKPSQRPLPLSFLHYLPRLVFFFGIVLASISYAQSVSEDKADEMVKTASPLEVSLQENYFLDQKTITFEIKTEETPIRYDVSLVSTEAFVLYDAPTKTIQSEDNKTLGFDLGERPKNPLELYVTVPSTFEGLLRVQSIFTDSRNSGSFLAAKAEKLIN